MRELKCRGKTIIDNKWVYGYYVRLDNDHYIYTIQNKLVEVETNSYENELIRYEVDPETVGQCTGLKDKNGKEIYEGDEVLYSCSVEEGKAEIKSHGNVNLYFDWIDSPLPPTISDIFGCAKELEIIGNIHDPT